MMVIRREGSQEGLFGLREIETTGDYASMGRALYVKPESFLSTLSQVNQFLFVSEWVGPDVLHFLEMHTDASVQHRVGIKMGLSQKALHSAGLIAADTHIQQFVVRGEGESVEGIDLNNVYTVGQAGSQNKEIEALALFRDLANGFPDAAIGFREAYLK